MSIKLQFACRAGIGNDPALIAQIECRPRGRIDTHVSHRPADGDFLDAGIIQQLLQVRVAKCTGGMLDYQRFVFRRLYAFTNFATKSVGYEKSCLFTIRQVLNVEYGGLFLTESVQ